MRDRRAAKSEKCNQAVFGALLDSDLPPEELSLTRLQHEAIGLIGAGLETTKRALTVGSFHILDNPTVLTRLREELISAIPNPENPPSLEVYEKLPYLSACIEESGCSRSKSLLPTRPVKLTNHVPPLVQPCAYRMVSPRAFNGLPSHKQSGTNHMHSLPAPKSPCPTIPSPMTKTCFRIVSLSDRSGGSTHPKRLTASNCLATWSVSEEAHGLV